MNIKGAWLRNSLIGVAALILASGLYGATSADFSRTTLPDLAKKSVPYEDAQQNGRPTLIEFYADWCATCKTMAPTIAKLERRFGQQINLVMLNADNPKWQPELDRYKVDAIPHYVLLGTDGEIKGNVIGEQSEALFAANLEALAAAKPLPYAKPTPGQTSTFKGETKPTATQPRDHSGS
jgi:thiol:disulfide interchange protein